MLFIATISSQEGEQKSFSGIGRRKSAVAQIQLFSKGNGAITINGRDVIDYMQYNPYFISTIREPLQNINVADSYDSVIKCSGGGLKGQAEAIQLGIARALCKMKESNRYSLKLEGYLTRNSLCKERKKYGLKKARKAPQFSKR